MRCLVLLASLAACAPAAGAACAVAGTADERPVVAPAAAARGPIVIAHRGASAARPEHTLAAYRLAIEQGADFIEPDLVLTRDGHLVARHENALGDTTDVADHPRFAARRTTKRIDGVEVTDWFSEDFTLAELRTLRARERLPALRPANTRWDGTQTIPTLVEIIALVRETAAAGRAVGIYPETKHPTFFAHEGRHDDGSPIHQSISERLIETLVAERFTDPARVYVQSFEIANLIDLAERIMPAAGVELPLIQLFGALDAPGDGSPARRAFAQPRDVVFHAAAGDDLAALYGGLDALVPGGLGEATHYGDLARPEVLTHPAARYAAGTGPWKETLLPRRPLGAAAAGEGASAAVLTGAVHPLLAHALAAGLEVHPYTLRPEPTFLVRHPDGRVQSPVGEVVQLLGLGVTGFFTDAPAVGVRGRALFASLTLDGDADAGGCDGAAPADVPDGP